MKHFSTPLLALASSLFIGASARFDVVQVPAEPVLKPSKVDWTVGKDGFSSPKVQPINGTTYDWWYFDARSEGIAPEVYAMQVVFYTSIGGGFDLLKNFNALGFNSVDLIQFTATWPNGSSFSTLLNGTYATFNSSDDGVVATYGGTGAKFVITPDLDHSVITIDAPAAGVVGTMKLKSVAPAHGPCGPNKPGQTLELVPHIGWSNGIPDADLSADFTLAGEKFAFKGYGYQDKNWGDNTFSPNVGVWYWGHTRLGKYSIVWLDNIASDGKTYLSAYFAEDGKILVAKCGGIKVRPIGANSTYPPVITTGPPSGFHIELDTPKGLFTFNVTNDAIVLSAEGDNGEPSPYYRWVGNVQGGFKGKTVLKGTSVLEQFVFRV